jgi:hypothetical protein
MKTETEKAVKETGEMEKAAKGKVEKEKGKAAQEKAKVNPEDLKRQ